MNTLLRLAFLVVTWLAWSGSAEAAACRLTADACDQGQAFAAAWSGAALEDRRAQIALSCPGGIRVDIVTANTNSYSVQGTCLTAGGGFGGTIATGTTFAGSCAARPMQTGWVYDASAGGDQAKCYEGCKYTGALDAGSPTGASYGATGTTCKAADFPAPIADADGDGVPDPDDAFPTDPNESVDTDGDGVGDNADFAPEDPTDGQDTPGEEDGDDEGDNQASGGGDCNAPPTCSGDGIQCAQLHTQWMIMCKGARVTGTPEICEASYTCEGDAGQCTEIALLRKTACAIDGIGTGGGGSDAAQELVDGLQGGPTDQPGFNPMGIWDSGADDVDPDASGFGLSRACPSPPTVMGKTIDFGGMCDLGAMIAALVLLMGWAHFAYAFTGD